MNQITLVFLGLAFLFFAVLVLKNFLNKKICTICIAVVLTWFTLLVLFYLNLFEDKIIIAILMGHTSLGLYYIWEKKVKEKYTVFRLPVLLSFIFIIYSILQDFVFNTLILIVTLWLVFSFIYFLRNNKKFNFFANKIIECCKKW